MKARVLIALVLSFALLSSFSVSAEAAAISGDLSTSTTGSGSYTLRTTHDNHVKATVVLKGLDPNSSYTVAVEEVGVIHHFFTAKQSSARGSLRVSATFGSGVGNASYTSGSHTLRVLVWKDGVSEAQFWSEQITLVFP